jgi:hypothetical protein
MGRRVLALLLASSVAWADDAPRMEPAKVGHVLTYQGWVLNEPGKRKLDDSIARWDKELFHLRAANTKLREDITEMAAKPALTWKGAAVLVGIGVVVGIAVAVPVVILVRR